MSSSAEAAVADRLAASLGQLEATLLSHFPAARAPADAQPQSSSACSAVLEAKSLHSSPPPLQVRVKLEEAEAAWKQRYSKATMATIERVGRKLAEVSEQYDINLFTSGSPSPTAAADVTTAHDDSFFLSHGIDAEDENSTTRLAFSSKAAASELANLDVVQQRHSATLKAARTRLSNAVRRLEQLLDSREFGNGLVKYVCFAPEHTPTDAAEAAVWTRVKKGDVKEQKAEGNHLLAAVTLADAQAMAVMNRVRYEAVLRRWQAVRRRYSAAVDEVNQRMCYSILALDEVEEKLAKKTPGIPLDY